MFKGTPELFFNNNKKTNTEWNTFNSMSQEVIVSFGIETYYIPRNIIEMDKISGDVRVSDFKEAYAMKMYLKTFELFEGADQYSKFGLDIPDTIQLVINMDAFKTQTSRPEPIAGDVIFVPQFKEKGNFYEVYHVEDEQDWNYTLGKRMLWRLDVQLWRYNREEINTGIEEIDSVVNPLSTSTVIDDNTELQNAGKEMVQPEDDPLNGFRI